MKNKEKNSENDSRSSHDTDFFDNSYYDKDMVVSYPYYNNNQSESQNNSDNNSRYTMSIGNPVHAAKTSNNECSSSNILRSPNETGKTNSSLKKCKSSSISSKVAKTSSGKCFSLLPCETSANFSHFQFL